MAVTLAGCSPGVQRIRLHEMPGGTTAATEAAHAAAPAPAPARARTSASVPAAAPQEQADEGSETNAAAQAADAGTPTANLPPEAIAGHQSPTDYESYRPPWWRGPKVTMQVRPVAPLVSGELPACDVRWSTTLPSLPEKPPRFVRLAQLEARWRPSQRRCAFAPDSNAAAEDWSEWITEVHAKLHPIFAGHYLDALARLGPEHAANSDELETIVEVEVDAKTGALLRVAVARSSGELLFDAVVLESIFLALPVPVPHPLSRAGSRAGSRFWVRWEFHRNPIYACSAYLANPVKP